MNLARFLGSVRGVAKVAVATSTASVNVDFDEDITSLQELFARLQWAGVRVNVPAHGEEGMCCGSCG